MSDEIEVVCNKDGEVRLLVDPLTHDVRSKRQLDAYKNILEQERYRERSKKVHWVACYHEPIKRVINEKKLKLNELGALLKLITYLQFKKDGALLKDGKPMTIQVIAKVLDKSERQTKAIIRSLVQSGIISNVGNNRRPKYTINKEYHSIGEIGKGMFTQLYQVKSREKTKEITLQEAGLLYKMLPWFHYIDCYLCSNPNAPVTEEINHLNHTELSKLIGENEKTVYNNMKNLINKGFIMKTESYGAVNYVVNPNIMYSQEGESDYIKLLRKQFDELERTSQS